jgi:hypothetical protein
MAQPPPEVIPSVEGFQIQKTAIPTQKVIRFLTPVGSVAMMANRKWLLSRLIHRSCLKERRM